MALKVRAAGGLVLAAETSGPLVAVVHRPHRLDWTFPKGKLDPGETPAQAALREVAEETGLRCVLGEHVGRVRYRDRKDRPKVVDYWVMRPVEGAEPALPTEEVDELRWLRVPDAVSVLSYERDRLLLSRAEARGVLGAR